MRIVAIIFDHECDFAVRKKNNVHYISSLDEQFVLSEWTLGKKYVREKNKTVGVELQCDYSNQAT